MDICSRLCESIEPGLGQNQGIYFTSIECRQSRADVTSDIHDLRVRPPRQELGLPPHRRRSYPGAGW